jgi:hypothetical protein
MFRALVLSRFRKVATCILDIEVSSSRMGDIVVGLFERFIYSKFYEQRYEFFLALFNTPRHL